MQYDVVIIGAGAAGLFCAIEAGKRGRRTLLIDHAKTVGKKIRIAGGGHCNFTNLNITPENYLSENPHFAVSALKRYTQFDFIKLVEKYKIAYHEKTLGQLFCDGSAQQIIDMLLAECEIAGVTVKTSVSVKAVKQTQEDFIIDSNIGDLTCDSLVISTGGVSIPKMGATDFGYKIAKQFNLKLIKPKAALVPFTLAPEILAKLSNLSGISFPAIVSCNGKSFKESVLFTHRGLSGPAILQISSYWREGEAIIINLLPDIDVIAKLKEFREKNAKQDIQTILAYLLPKRLAQYIAQENSFNGKIAELSNKQLELIVSKICHWQITPSGTEGFRTAEVTKGGVDTKEISSQSFVATKVRNLYFIGEVLDVTGHLGGYNFQWAWSSGWSAGQFV